MARPPAYAPRLSRELILTQTLALIDARGLAAFNMRALAQALGVNQASLYHYFPGKEEVLAGVYAEVLNTVAPLPRAQLGWQDRLRQFAHTLAQLAEAHPRMLPYLLQPRAPSLEDYRRLEYVADALKDSGVADEQIPVLASQFISSLLHAFAAALPSSAQQDDLQEQADFLAGQEQRFPRVVQMLTVLRRQKPPDELLVEHFVLGVEGLIRKERTG